MQMACYLGYVKTHSGCSQVSLGLKQRTAADCQVTLYCKDFWLRFAGNIMVPAQGLWQAHITVFAMYETAVAAGLQ